MCGDDKNANGLANRRRNRSVFSRIINIINIKSMMNIIGFKNRFMWWNFLKILWFGCCLPSCSLPKRANTCFILFLFICSAVRDLCVKIPCVLDHLNQHQMAKFFQGFFLRLLKNNHMQMYLLHACGHTSNYEKRKQNTFYIPSPL